MEHVLIDGFQRIGCHGEVIMNRRKIIIISISLLIIALSIVIIKNVFLSNDIKSKDNIPQKTVEVTKENDTKPINTNTNNIECDICVIESNGDKVNNSDLLKKEIVVDEYTFKNIKIVSHKENYDDAELSFELINNSSIEKTNESFAINLYDKDGNLKNSILYYADKIPANGKVEAKRKYEYRIIDSYSLKIEKVIVAGY